MPIKKAILYAVLVLAVLFLGQILKFNIDLNNSMRLDIDARKYQKAELVKSNLISRSWMNVAIAINKIENLAPANSARFYSYAASVYTDILEKTNDRGQASVGTAELLDYLFPAYKGHTRENLDRILQGVKITLDPAALEILERYKGRSRTDGYDMIWDGVVPEGKWFVRNDKTDKGAMAGNWKPWVLESGWSVSVPEPPKEGSLWDKLEIEIVDYAVKNRESKDLHTIYVWHGSTGFEKGSTGDNITPAGVWQNILFVEKGAELNELEYARAQKVLAQTIADAFIESWKVKYEFWTKRPSMVIPDLDLAVGDPPFPSYVSGHSTISAAAATILSYLFSDEEDIWEDNARDARNSRLAAGIHFNVDNQVGFFLGQEIGREVIQNLKHISGEASKKSYKTTSNFQARIGLIALDIREGLDKTKSSITGLFGKIFGEPVSFVNAIDKSGIDVENPIGGAAWADYDNDGLLDIYLGGGGLYRNNGDGTFTEVSQKAGVVPFKLKNNDLQETRGIGIFADLDNDGCRDLYLSNSGSFDFLYRNNCDGTFTDVTATAGIKSYDFSQGWAFSDYNGDGFLDIYVARVTTVGRSNNATSQLYKNNGNWTFTEVAKQANVLGAAKCDNIETFDNPVTGKTNLLSNAVNDQSPYQPIWFDYNNDLKPDLFVATDFGVSPLYKNNGDGTFDDVTREVGMCREGTGMGATVADYDRDGDLDLYVTHVGQNQLWQNNGDGTFTEVSDKAGAANWGSLGWGTEFLDYDNDSDPDLYAVNGVVSTFSLTSKVVSKMDKLYKNNSDGTFKEVSQQAGITGNDPKFSAAVGDFNNDGFEDIFVGAQRGRFSDNKAFHRLYLNQGNGNNWLTLKLVGTESNRDAVGARITLTANGKSQVREVISGSSFLSQRSLWQTFGLGSAKKADSIEIRWPSGKVQTLANVEAGQTLTITEE